MTGLPSLNGSRDAAVVPSLIVSMTHIQHTVTYSCFSLNSLTDFGWPIADIYVLYKFKFICKKQNCNVIITKHFSISFPAVLVTQFLQTALHTWLEYAYTISHKDMLCHGILTKRFGNRPIIRGFDSPKVQYRVRAIDRPSVRVSVRVRVRVTIRTALSNFRTIEPSD